MKTNPLNTSATREKKSVNAPLIDGPIKPEDNISDGDYYTCSALMAYFRKYMGLENPAMLFVLLGREFLAFDFESQREAVADLYRVVGPAIFGPRRAETSKEETARKVNAAYDMEEKARVGKLSSRERGRLVAYYRSERDRNLARADRDFFKALCEATKTIT